MCVLLKLARLLHFSILCLILPDLATAEELFDNFVGVDGNYDVIAFVGRKVSFKERNISTIKAVTLPDGSVVKREILNFDTRYEARYDVLDWIVGGPSDKVVDFELFDHYGRPILPRVDTPLIFLINHKGRWISAKYAHYTVSKTSDGDWAICGLPSRNEKSKDQGRRYLSAVEFVKRRKNRNGEDCTVGTRAIDIYKYLYETRFAPEQRRIACNAKLGVAEFSTAGTGSEPNAAEIKLAHSKCIERLKVMGEAK